MSDEDVKPRKSGATLEKDPEMVALGRMNKILTGMTAMQRKRMLNYLSDKEGSNIELPLATRDEVRPAGS